MDRLSNALNVTIEFFEPYNHHGTGKVERTIQMVQQILRAFNVESGNTFTSKHSDKQKSWEIIKGLLPLIQFELNQKRSRFTSYSPNMLMFGKQLNEIQDIQLFEDKLKLHEIKNEEDYEFFRDLVNKLKIIQENSVLIGKITHISPNNNMINIIKHYKNL